MPALLTSSGRPGFYFRVLQEGEVGAGDEIVKVGEAKERMTVAEINALLYLPNHTRDRLERALRIEALSPGWRASFEALLHSDTAAAGSGNAGLAPAAAARKRTFTSGIGTTLLGGLPPKPSSRVPLEPFMAFAKVSANPASIPHTARTNAQFANPQSPFGAKSKQPGYCSTCFATRKISSNVVTPLSTLLIPSL
jgi:hypothetical protein